MAEYCSLTECNECGERLYGGDLCTDCKIQRKTAMARAAHAHESGADEDEAEVA